MDLEIVAIGTELLLGFTHDTNGDHIAAALAGIGVRVTRRTSVGDDPDQIAGAVRDGLARTGAVITTGGLGPTRDDLTREAVAGLFEAPLEFDEALWQALLQRYASFGRVPSPSNRAQVHIPRGATVLPNRWGTAPGIWLEGPPGLVVMLPGVPNEMQNLLAHEVVPRLAGRGGGAVIRSRTVRTTAIAESALGELVAGMEAQLAPLTLAYLPGLAGVDLRLTAWNHPPREADRLLAEGVARLAERVARHRYGEEDADLAAVLLDRIRARGSRLALAESCTGGMIGQRVTAVPGASDVFAGAIVAYEDAAKVRHLGVPPALLERHGAVSEEVAGAMASGAAAALHTDLAIAITGIAGPAGGSEAKPVGLVCYATLTGGEVRTHRYTFPGNREEIRSRASQWAMFAMLRRLGVGS